MKQLLAYAILINTWIWGMEKPEIITSIFIDLTQHLYEITELNNNDHYEIEEALNRTLQRVKSHTLMPNTNNKNTLHWAAMYGNKAIIEHILAAQFNINECNTKGQTPLMVAALAGNIEGVQTLIGHGANLIELDKKGRSALDYANKIPYERDCSKKLSILFQIACARYKNDSAFERCHQLIYNALKT